MTRIAVLGTGQVGRVLAGRLADVGHDVVLGSRTASDDTRTFADAAGDADVVVNATGGIVSLDALAMAGADSLAGKPLLDLSNALDHSARLPAGRAAPTQTESNAERIQAAFPAARVVKWLNTMNNSLMADPVSCPARTPRSWPATTRRRRGWRGACCATWAGARRRSSTWVTSRRPVASSCTCVLWLRMAGALGGSGFNIHVVRG